jgi:hypothetical protein
VDLISLESPFITEPSVPDIKLEDSNSKTKDFEQAWDELQSFNARGWCEITVDEVMHRLQPLKLTISVLAPDEPPFKGKPMQALLPFPLLSLRR